MSVVIVLAVVIPRSITGLRSSVYVAIQLNSSSSKTITVFSFVSNMSANQNLSDQSILLDFRCVLPINGNARSKISDALKAIRYWSSTALCHRDLAGLRRDSSTNPFRKYQLRSKASKCKIVEVVSYFFNWVLKVHLSFSTKVQQDPF